MWSTPRNGAFHVYTSPPSQQTHDIDNRGTMIVQDHCNCDRRMYVLLKVRYQILRPNIAFFAVPGLNNQHTSSVRQPANLGVWKATDISAFYEI